MAKDINLPNFLIVGAAKCGTTSLHNYLKQHPDIFMTEHKEPHFLINSDIGEMRIHNAVVSFEEYKNMFKTNRKYFYKGESSVMYLAFPEFSINNIKKYLDSNVKIIIMLRNPIERAFSGYLHNLRYNTCENLSFEEAIEKSEYRYHNDRNITPDTRYLHVGEYYTQVKAFIDEFKENVHIIYYDEYLLNIKSCLDNVFDFLKIRKVKIDTSIKYMKGGWLFKNRVLRYLLISSNPFKSLIKNILPSKDLRRILKNKIMRISTVDTPKISNETRDKLKRYYRQDMLDLSKLLNRDLSHWINPN